MTKTGTDVWISRALAGAMVAAPAMLLLMAALHFAGGRDFFDFRAAYVAPPASAYVPRLIAAGRTSLHEPHMLGYLGLPLLSFAALGLYALGRERRPLGSAVGLALSLFGMVYLGGTFGVWTALFHGFADVEPQYADGATAAWASITGPHGVLGLTTTLAKVALAGFAVQAACVAGARGVPRWAPLVAALGCAVIVAFWDLDNWMMIGEAGIFAGMVAIGRAVARGGDVQPPARYASASRSSSNT